jgi:hypothetical protein
MPYALCFQKLLDSTRLWADVALPLPLLIYTPHHVFFSLFVPLSKRIKGVSNELGTLPN